MWRLRRHRRSPGNTELSFRPEPAPTLLHQWCAGRTSQRLGRRRPASPSTRGNAALSQAGGANPRAGTGPGRRQQPQAGGSAPARRQDGVTASARIRRVASQRRNGHTPRDFASRIASLGHGSSARPRGGPARRLDAAAVPRHDAGGTDDPRGTASSLRSSGRAEATRRRAVALARQGGRLPHAALAAPRAAR
jgi:hypothetical protein